MRFDWRAVLVLPSDVEFVEAGALSPRLRAEVLDADDEFVVQRPGSRESAKALSADAVRLLEAFRHPRSIVDVLISLSRSLGLPAERLLEETFPILRSMIRAGILAVHGTEAAAPLAPLLAPGARLERWTIGACVRVVEDSEVYHARDGDLDVALKRLRPRGAEQGLTELLRREAAVLVRLGGEVTPKLIEESRGGELAWIAISWCDGVRADRLGTDRDHTRIALAIVDAYRKLHEQGVLHGDVHPGNVMVDKQDCVTLIDFALARVPGDPSLDRIFRGAAHIYWEPEFAAEMLKGGAERPATPKGEQYAVATLLDSLLAGEPSFTLPAVAEHQWDAILGADRRCFAQRGRGAWPTIERALRRAMDREPGRRHADMSAFARELHTAAAWPAAVVPPADDPIDAFVRVAAPGGRFFEQGVLVPPRSSFNFGASGIAFALYRIARAQDDGDLFSLAEVWQARAEADLDQPDGLYDVTEFRQEELGRISPYHGATGVWLTRALLARAAGDILGADRAVSAYVGAAAGEEAVPLDLTLGRSAGLLGAALLYGTRPQPGLRSLGDRLLASTWEELGLHPPIADGGAIRYLGIAHGWAGFIYAALAWAHATATPVRSDVVERLTQLGELTGGTAGPEPRAPLVAPIERAASQTMDGWCHGQAGHVFLHLLAARVLDVDGHVETAARFGLAAWSGGEELGNLCCGLAGRAYAMLALHRRTNDSVWLERARLLSARAGHGTHCDRWPNSLYKGRTGLAVLAAEVQRPEVAAMPLFEDEGWL